MSRNKALEAFDAAMAPKGVTAERGQVYGHPKDDFGRIAKLTAALPEFADPRLAHIARMLCIKLCRLSQTPNHLDSLIDIAGYARTWVMIVGEEEPTEGDQDAELKRKLHEALKVKNVVYSGPGSGRYFRND